MLGLDAAARWLDGSKRRNEMAAVETEMVRTGLGGYGSNKITEMVAAQASNSSKETAAVATTAVQTGLGGNSGNEMTAGLAAAARRIDGRKISN